MLGKISVGNHPAFRFSLAHKLGLLGLDGRVPVPDAIAFTIKTAVPIADVIRGVFDTAGLDTPHLFGIHANHLMSSLERISHNAAPEVDEEVARIASLRESRRNVVVIDEFQHSGNTLNLAVKILDEAGYDTCTPIAGMWYQNVWPEDQRLEELSSAYSSKMQRIGRICYETFLNLPTWQISNEPAEVF